MTKVLSRKRTLFGILSHEYIMAVRHSSKQPAQWWAQRQAAQRQAGMAASRRIKLQAHAFKHKHGAEKVYWQWAL